jgi:hypothetical protein
VKFLVRVRVDVGLLERFGQALRNGTLDRSCVRGETYCLGDDPAVGYSVWEAESRDDFDARFSSWKEYYAEAEAWEVIAPDEAMLLLVTMKR